MSTLEESTPTVRTTSAVGILRLSAKGFEAMHHYYCVVDLPSSENLVIEYGEYDAATKTLSFQFTYPDGVPPDGTGLKSYITPVFMINSEAESFQGLNTVSISGIIDSSNEPTTKTGSTANQKKKVLFEEPESQDAPSGDNTEGDGNPPFNENYVRLQVIQSETFPTNYFVIAAVRTQGSNSKLLNMAPETNIGGGEHVQLSYTQLPEGQEHEGSVVATNAIPSTVMQYGSFYFEANNTYDPNYQESAVIKV